jgi:hypothetical protein
MVTRAELLDEIDQLCDCICDEAHAGWEKARLDDCARTLWRLLAPGPTAHEDEG